MLASEKQKVKAAYLTLGLFPGASDEEIRAAYIRLVKEYHPDSTSSSTNTDEKLKRINVAFTILRQIDQRTREDEGLKKKRGRYLPNHSKKDNTLRWLLLSLLIGGVLTVIGVYGLAFRARKPEPQMAIKQPQPPVLIIEPMNEGERRDYTAPGKQASLPRRFIESPVIIIEPLEPEERLPKQTAQPPKEIEEIKEKVAPALQVAEEQSPTSPKGAASTEQLPVNERSEAKNASVVEPRKAVVAEDAPVKKVPPTRKRVEMVQAQPAKPPSVQTPPASVPPKRADRIVSAEDQTRTKRTEHVNDVLSGGL